MNKYTSLITSKLAPPIRLLHIIDTATATAERHKFIPYYLPSKPSSFFWSLSSLHNGRSEVASQCWKPNLLVHSLQGAGKSQI